LCSTWFLFAFFACTALAYGEFFVDSRGTVTRIDPNAPGVFAQHGRPTKALKDGNLNWDITFEDVEQSNGFGFDDPAEGATRRATMIAVLEYVNGVINEATGATLVINIHESNNEGDTTLAYAGTLWNEEPSRFDNGFAFEHITTGIDPTPNFGDIFVTVDFGFDWNSGLGDPIGLEFDLFTVLLHEITHGLGILSLTDDEGQGLQGLNPDVYSVWDQLLRFNEVDEIWSSSDPVTTLLLPASVLSSDNIQFSGTHATTAFGGMPPVYAPDTWRGGSSIAHYDRSFVDSVMLHSVLPGTKKREYTPVDLATLKDIGYTQVVLSSGGGGDGSDYGEPNPIDPLLFDSFNPLETLPESAILATVGDTITLHAAPGQSGYVWDRDGVALNDGDVDENGSVLSGATTDTLTISNIQLEDLGNYHAAWASKAAGETGYYFVAVIEASLLPAHSLLGLAMLGAALFGTGTSRQRRKK
jgi:hypothetical protein